MERIILSGGGNEKQTTEIDKEFSKLLDKSKPLLYIPIAIDKTKHPYPECLKWLKSVFSKLGVRNYEMLTEDNLTHYKYARPENFSGIYIGGGNAPYLLKILKDSGIWSWLKNAVEKIPAYGGSAGAMMFSKTIIPSLATDKNKVSLKDFTAMNKLDNFEIWCHYKKGKDEKISDFIMKYKLNKVIALPEETGILIENDKGKIIGNKSAFIFKDKNKKGIKAGESIFFSDY